MNPENVKRKMKIRYNIQRYKGKTACEVLAYKTITSDITFTEPF